LDGVEFSMSWYFEYALDWKSILIEPQGANYEKLLINRPNAIKVKAAACTGDIVQFKSRPGALSGILETMNERHIKNFGLEKDSVVTITCTRLSDIFAANNVSRIDIFVLDVEGGEYEALLTMDWDIEVLVWIIELDGDNKTKDDNVRNLLASHGYIRKDWDINIYCQNCEHNEVFMKSAL